MRNFRPRTGFWRHANSRGSALTGAGARPGPAGDGDVPRPQRSARVAGRHRFEQHTIYTDASAGGGLRALPSPCSPPSRWLLRRRSRSGRPTATRLAFSCTAARRRSSGSRRRRQRPSPGARRERLQAGLVPSRAATRLQRRRLGLSRSATSATSTRSTPTQRARAAHPSRRQPRLVDPRRDRLRATAEYWTSATRRRRAAQLDRVMRPGRDGHARWRAARPVGARAPSPTSAVADGRKRSPTGPRCCQPRYELAWSPDAASSVPRPPRYLAHAARRSLRRAGHRFSAAGCRCLASARAGRSCAPPGRPRAGRPPPGSSVLQARRGSMCVTFAPGQVRALEALDAVDQDVGRPLAALQPAGGQHQRLRAHRQPEALLDRRRHDQVDRAVLVLEQHERDALGGRRALARDDQARHAHAPAVAAALELRARVQVGGQARAASARAGARAASRPSSRSRPASAPTPTARAAPARRAARAAAPAGCPRPPARPGTATPSCQSAWRRRPSTGPSASSSQAPAQASLPSVSAEAPERAARSPSERQGPPCVALGRQRADLLLLARRSRSRARAAPAASLRRRQRGAAARPRRAAAPPPPPAAPRAPASRAGRSPSAARSAASRGTRGGSARAARSTGRRAARRRPSAPWGSRSPRSRRSGARPARPTSRAAPRSTAPSTNFSS